MSSSGPTSSTEVLERPARRRFSAAYKLRILEEAEACREPGQIAALLRREGLYHASLTKWRKLRARGALTALGSRKAGRPAAAVSAEAEEVARLRRDVTRLQRELDRARMILEIQKKASELLGLPLSQPECDGSD